MLSSFFKEKRNIIVLIFSALILFATTIIGASPFATAFIGALIILKIPIIFPFAIIAIGSLIAGGMSSFIPIVLFTLIFAIIKTIWKSEDSAKNNLYKYFLSIAITYISLFIIGTYTFDNFLTILLQGILSGTFVIIYKSAIDNCAKFIEKSALKEEEIIAIFIMIISGLSFLKNIEIFGMTLLSTVCVFMIMLLSCKKKIRQVLLSAGMIIVVLGLFEKLAVLYVLLLLVVAIITSLLSKAGKNGIMLGFICSLAIVIAGSFKVNPEVSVESLSNIASRQMLVGFLALLCLPKSFFELFAVDIGNDGQIRAFLEKMFKKMPSYLLPEGKNNSRKAK